MASSSKVVPWDTSLNVGGCKCCVDHNRKNWCQSRLPHLQYPWFCSSRRLPTWKLLTSQGSLDEKLGETNSAIATTCLKDSMVKHFPEQNPLEEMMHGSLFISTEPILFEMARSATFEEYDSEEILHFCEDEWSSSLSAEFEPLPAGPNYVVLYHDRDSTMIFHDKSLDGEFVVQGILWGTESGIWRKGFHRWAWELQSGNTTKTMLI